MVAVRAPARRRGQDVHGHGPGGTFAGGGSTATDIEGGTQLGGHDPNQRGFTVQGVEANFRGAVDPYFRGNANVVFQLDADGESFLELEEAWLETMSLPANLQVRAGQYLTEFGRINTQHPHTWAFVDVPLVNGRLLGAGRPAQSRRAAVVAGADALLLRTVPRGAEQPGRDRLQFPQRPRAANPIWAG